MVQPKQSLRAQHAEQTRQQILGAARRLFTERGYTRTTVRDIADEAGVSAQTVYDSVGSKKVLVSQLNDLIDAEAGIPELAASIGAAENPREILATQAAITRSILEHCGDIVVALLTGSDAEPELQQVLAEGRRRHLEGARTVIDAVVARGALARDLQPHEAAESLAAISDIGVAVILHTAYQWSLDRIQGWIANSSATLLLPQHTPPTSRPP